MTTDNIQLVITAKDNASASIKSVEGSFEHLQQHATGSIGKVNDKLLQMTRSTRLMKRETFGISKFAGALDTVAGTRFGGLISDLLTVAEVAHPLKEIGQGIAESISGAFNKLGQNPIVAKAIDGASAVMNSRLVQGLKSAAASPAGAAAAGVVGAIIVDQIMQAFEQKFSEARSRLDLALLTPGTAARLKQNLGPLEGLLNVAGDLMINVPILGGAMVKFGQDVKGITGDIDSAAVSMSNLSLQVQHALSEIADQNSQHAGLVTQNFLNSLWQPQIAAHAAQEHADQYATDFAREGGRAMLNQDIFKGSLKATTMQAAHQAALAGSAELSKTAIWQHSAHAIDADLAGALKSGRNLIKTAMDTVMWAINHPLKEQHQKSRIEGTIAKMEYLKGLNSNNQQIDDIINQQEAVLETQWSQITGVAYTAGADAARTYNKGFAHVPAPTVKTPHGVPSSAVNRWNPPHRATGGPVTAGQSYWVGERGPEQVTFNRSGYVHPNNSPGQPQAQPIQIFLDGKKIFDVVDQRMGKRLALTTSAAYTRG